MHSTRKLVLMWRCKIFSRRVSQSSFTDTSATDLYQLREWTNMESPKNSTKHISGQNITPYHNSACTSVYKFVALILFHSHTTSEYFSRLYLLTSMNLKLYVVCLSYKLLRIQLRFSTGIAIARAMKEKSRELIFKENKYLYWLPKCAHMAGKVLTKRKPSLFLECHIKSQSIGFMKLTISRSLHPRLDKCYKWPFREPPVTLWQSHQPGNFCPVFELSNVRLLPNPDLSLITTEPDTDKKNISNHIEKSGRKETPLPDRCRSKCSGRLFRFGRPSLEGCSHSKEDQ